MGCESYTLTRSTGHRGDSLRRLSERYWASLVEETQSQPHDTLVLSCEGFWAVPAQQEPGFHARLSVVCGRVTIVGYLRSPARRFLSQLNQNVRMFRGAILPCTEYYHRPVIEAYRGAGCQSILLNAFEAKRLADGDVVTDFCSKYRPAGVPKLRRGKGEKSNERDSNETLALLDNLLRCHPSRDPIVTSKRRAEAAALIRAADLNLGGNRWPSLRPGIADAIIAQSLDLIWLRDEFDFTFADVDHDLVGPQGHADLFALRRAEDLCPIDADRLAALHAPTHRDVARSFRPSPLRNLVRRLSWSTHR
jgi:hypothetical protein